MHIVEVPQKRSRDSHRLFRATVLLFAGVALHVWLFPSPAGQGMLDRVTARFVRAAEQNVVATTGIEEGVIASGLGDAVPALADSAPSSEPARANRAGRVKVVIETVRPTLVPPLIHSRPGRFENALFTTVRFPEPALEIASSEEIAGEPRFELPVVSDTPVNHPLGKAFRESQPPPMPVANAPASAPRAVTEKTDRRELSRRVEPPSDERLVGNVLQQYRQAYESLDVSAAKNVWPTVDARALGAAFRQLAGQRVTFESCGVEVSGSGSQATARCTGQAEYVPKVGGRRAYTASGEWVFDLQKENAAWRIINANANIK